MGHKLENKRKKIFEEGEEMDEKIMMKINICSMPSPYIYNWEIFSQ
jgi:hypothetical protein